MFPTNSVSANLSASVTGSYGAGAVNTSTGAAVGNPTNAHTSMQGGKAVFENDNYRISAGDNNEVTIFNKNTGESYRVWGDPHVDVDGKHTFDFWGTTTFNLNDGTKLTFETVPAGNNMTLASKLTITNGDYGAKISGIDTNTTGDLKVEEANGWGRTLDQYTADGNTLLENGAGKGFLAVDGSGKVVNVDQTYINATDLQKGGAGKAQQQQQQLAAQLFAGAFSSMSGLLSISLAGALLRSLGGGDDGGSRPQTGGHSHGGGSWGSVGGGFGGNTGAGQFSLNLELSFSLTLTRWNG